MEHPVGNPTSENVEMTSTAQQSPPGSTSTVQPDARESNDDRIVWRRLLQRKLLLRVTIPTAIGLVQLVLSIIAIVSGDARPILLLFMLPALLVGYLFGKSTRIGWNDERAQVSLIQAQALLAVSYIVVRIGTHYLLELTLGSRINGLATALLLVSFGLFFGRSVGLAIQIWHALVGRDSRGPRDTNPA
jgi:hypothetical protein